MKELTQAVRLSPSEIPQRIYGVDNWGTGYFGVSEQGCLTIHPTRNPLMGVEVINLIHMLLQRKVTPPFLIRFPQILDTQIKDFHEAFRNSIAEYSYGARHRGVYPMKVPTNSRHPRPAISLPSSGMSYGSRCSSSWSAPGSSPSLSAN